MSMAAVSWSRPHALGVALAASLWSGAARGPTDRRHFPNRPCNSTSANRHSRPKPLTKASQNHCNWKLIYIENHLAIRRICKYLAVKNAQRPGRLRSLESGTSGQRRTRACRPALGRCGGDGGYCGSMLRLLITSIQTGPSLARTSLK
jgi:hypothetical protein